MKNSETFSRENSITFTHFPFLHEKRHWVRTMNYTPRERRGKNNDLKWFIASKLITHSTRHHHMSSSENNRKRARLECEYAEDWKTSAGETRLLSLWREAWMCIKYRLELPSLIRNVLKKENPWMMSTLSCEMWVGAALHLNKTFNFCWIEFSSRKMRCLWMLRSSLTFANSDLRCWKWMGRFVDVVRLEKQ